MDSRNLGPITLEGGEGGGYMEATVEVAGSSVPFRLEIDYPARFDEDVVRKIDIAIDNLSELDALARRTMTTALAQSDSAPARLFASLDGYDDPADFIALLRPTFVTLLPDGGQSSRDRVIFVYALAERPSEKITLRIREGIGAELDPAPSGAYG
jgi:hypothetical protein